MMNGKHGGPGISPEAIQEGMGSKEVTVRGAIDIEAAVKDWLRQNDIEPIKPIGGLPGKDGSHIGCDYAYYLWTPKPESGPRQLVGVLAGHFVEGEWSEAIDNASFIPANELDVDKLLGRE